MPPPKAARMQSPSSILCYKQCPRKYYYQYIAKLPTKENIHLVRGKLVHAVLESFFDLNTTGIIQQNYVERLTNHLKDLFHKEWDRQKPSIRKHCKSDYDVVHYYEDTLQMMANWLNHIFLRLHPLIKEIPFQEAFARIKPAMIEEEFRSPDLNVRGFIDYIEHHGDEVKIMDYKTSKHGEMTPEYRLQLAIYALLYSEKFGKHANKVGLWFLKHGEVTMDVTEELINDARFEIEQIHLNTQTVDMADYPKNVGPLCRWSSGECDFYRVCFGHEPMPQLMQIRETTEEKTAVELGVKATTAPSAPLPTPVMAAARTL